MPVTVTQPEVFGARLAAGAVPAEKLPDGTIVVRNVPIFAEIKPSDPGVQDGDRMPRDRAWLERAVAKHQERLALGRKPIMTLRHHFDEPRRVGFYLLDRVEEAEVNPGDIRPTVFGTKVYESEAAFREAQGYTDRSIEVSPDYPEEFAALALLRDKEPFFKFPGLVEQLFAPEARQAFAVEAHRARAGFAPQVWRGAPEDLVFESRPAANRTTTNSPGAAPSAAPNSYQEEGVMPPEAQAGEKKTPSLEERMEAMASKCFEGMAKKFEAMFSAATSGKKDDAAPAGDKKPEAAESDGDADDQKKPEAAEAAGPNGALPPAVSEVRVGESFSLRVLAGKDKVPASHQSTAPEVEAFGAKLATLETANLGLKARLEKMEREKEAVGHVANAKRALADMGILTVTEAFESALSKAAVKSGKAGCDELLESVKLTMGLTSRAPETYGAMALGGPAGNGQGPDDLKKAIDAFASRPEQSRERSLIQEMFQAYREAPEHLRRSLGSFDKLVAGHAGINPSIMDSRGGMGRA